MAEGILRRSPVVAFSAIRTALPRGGLLPEEVWESRHRWIIALLAGHVAAILVFALARGFWPPHAVFEASVPAVAAIAASQVALGRRVRAIAASFGLLSSSALLVHISGGYIEMHFHFFVMMIVISLYQEWASFLLAFLYVVVHHGLVGALDPTSVYNHVDAIANPWKWALIHGGFIAAACIASLANWRLNEEEFLARLALERRARVSAEAGVRVREEFLSVATHELRTPVASIKGYAQLAIRTLAANSDGESERLRSMLRLLDAQSDRLSRLVTQLLDASRIEAGRLALERVRTDLVPLVMNVVEVAREASKRDKWVIDVPAGVEAVVDHGRIEQVVTNLIENAVRYTPSDATIVVRLVAEREGVRIEVADDGPGIPQDALGHLFDRFYQVHHDESHGDMGLGLYIAKEIVERHGGTITAASTLGKGSRFTVWLPRAVVATERGGAAPVSHPPARPVSEPSERGGESDRGSARARILAIEDDPDIGRVVENILLEEGYEVLLAPSARRALDLVDSVRPDLILLDKLMPGMDGSAFAAAYHARPGPHAPIVALCAARDAAAWAASIGAVDHVAKPFGLDQLVLVVERHAKAAAERREGVPAG